MVQTTVKLGSMVGWVRNFEPKSGVQAKESAHSDMLLLCSSSAGRTVSGHAGKSALRCFVAISRPAHISTVIAGPPLSPEPGCPPDMLPPYFLAHPNLLLCCLPCLHCCLKCWNAGSELQGHAACMG
eukprot:424097-Pelagomonas_calceolata.AAC.4